MVVLDAQSRHDVFVPVVTAAVLAGWQLRAAR